MITHSTLSEKSPSAPGVTVGSKVADNLDQFDKLAVYLTTRGGVGGLLNVTLQISHDGQRWYDWFRSNDIPPSAAPSTFKVTSREGEPTATIVGTGTSSPAAAVPALTKGSVAPGLCGRRMRAVYEAGAGTTAGALQDIIVVGMQTPKR